MDSVKIRDIIVMKLDELGAYVDDELPDYIMVMLANKKTNGQMTEDLNLFLGRNALTFTKWLNEVVGPLRNKQQATTTNNQNNPSTDSGEWTKDIKKKSKEKSSVAKDAKNVLSKTFDKYENEEISDQQKPGALTNERDPDVLDIHIGEDDHDFDENESTGIDEGKIACSPSSGNDRFLQLPASLPHSISREEFHEIFGDPDELKIEENEEEQTEERIVTFPANGQLGLKSVLKSASNGDHQIVVEKLPTFLPSSAAEFDEILAAGTQRRFRPRSDGETCHDSSSSAKRKIIFVETGDNDDDRKESVFISHNRKKQRRNDRHFFPSSSSTLTPPSYPKKRYPSETEQSPSPPPTKRMFRNDGGRNAGRRGIESAHSVHPKEYDPLNPDMDALSDTRIKIEHRRSNSRDQHLKSSGVLLHSNQTAQRQNIISSHSAPTTKAGNISIITASAAAAAAASTGIGLKRRSRATIGVNNNGKSGTGPSKNSSRMEKDSETTEFVVTMDGIEDYNFRDRVESIQKDSSSKVMTTTPWRNPDLSSSSNNIVQKDNQTTTTTSSTLSPSPTLINIPQPLQLQSSAGYIGAYQGAYHQYPPVGIIPGTMSMPGICHQHQQQHIPYLAPVPNVIQFLQPQPQPLTVISHQQQYPSGTNNIPFDGAGGRRQGFGIADELEDFESVKVKNDEKCRFWPNCTKDNCPFIHPVSNCSKFPACRFGNSCKFIHPPCKYAASCTKPACPFSHVVSRAQPIVNDRTNPQKRLQRT